ncbi:hypothetical protein ACFY1L_55310 [Streptomyces sp. NPDC001663]|uniref:hypothetical protein n=1 Tax=Streptomyces sp. NPDC001663 TaxID=3364597 RepID=UPI0036D00874
MTRSDFAVLQWDSRDGLDEQLLVRQYEAGGYNGIYLRVPREGQVENLNFLGALPGLKYIEVNGAVRDDSEAFKVPGIREIVLLTRSQQAIPAEPSPSIEKIGTDARQGLSHLATIPRLTNLQLWNFAGKDLSWVSRCQHLAHLKIEGMGQSVELCGVEACVSLVDLELLEMRVVGLEPLRHLMRLQRLWILGNSDFAADPPMDLDDLSSLEQLEELRITYSGSVRSAQPLLGLPALKDVRLRGTEVLDRNLHPLELLSSRITVVGPGE